MPGLVALVVLLWSLGGVDIELHHVAGPVRFTDLYGNDRTAPGALACPPEGPPQLWLSTEAGAEIVVHELAHALDCADDGLLNGSPAPRPDARPGWVSDYCWSSEAEWYACAVAHTGSLRPPTATR